MNRKEGCVASFCWVVRLVGFDAANGPEIVKVGGGDGWFIYPSEATSGRAESFTEFTASALSAMLSE